MRIVMSLLFLLAAMVPAAATEAGWALLRNGGHVVLLRHAITPGGGGEPANFDIENCATQRNLSDRGKQQARKMGALFAARAETTERVLSSRYCNALETARIAFGDKIVEPLAALDQPAPGAEVSAEQKEAILKEIRAFTGSGNLVLVTHQEIIAALTGQTAREGEAVIVKPDGQGLHILGRIVFN
ncbi:histidine phosphatase family protein [Pseudaminobacter soli (ex Li et al. 2025)]|uniref:Histidine phosphatase family protein n=1 Tax=Pseudaminobacter soli (ex Li et al. 2025) TaxID=1295366 RepID=A0A2P7SN38_9HYPH|nr:histidine phosphatase family protein [Mesorhizobium soli]PSJ63878.1 histidine phosphatase family protein [Mesorhizobium soli]